MKVEQLKILRMQRLTLFQYMGSVDMHYDGSKEAPAFRDINFKLVKYIKKENVI